MRPARLLRPTHPLDREIIRLAIPAFLALVAEPLYLLADTAIVGRLGTAELAGLGIAGAVLHTAVGLCIFLAYGTTAAVARHLGAGDLRRALAQGIDGVWLAILIGAVITVVGILLARPLVGAFAVDAAIADQAVIYLRIALLGMAPLLVMLAATGVLRGLQDTRTPLVVAVIGNLANIVLNVVLVYGAGLGIAGSAIGSVIAQTGAAAALFVVILKAARREGVRLAPDLAGIRAAGRASLPLLIRNLTLRASVLVGTYAIVLASGPGEAQAVGIATHQLAWTIWSFLAFALDSIAIAAQALVGRYLGAGDREAVRAVTRRLIHWGWASGVVSGLGLAIAAPFVGALFTTDPAVRDLLVPVLIVAALGQPIAGVAFVLDGVLIGAGDGRYLAWAGLVVLAIYAPIVLAVAWLAETHGGEGWQAGVTWVWVVLSAVFMGARLAVLVRRARSDAWMVTGAR